MWWEPTNEREIALANDVQRLQNWFVEGLPTEWPPIASAVGSIWSPKEQALVPFVLLNSEFATEFPSFELLPVNAVSIPPLPFSLPETRLQTYAMALPHPRPTTSLLSYSRQVQKERLLAELVQIREPIICKRSGNQGSAGVVVWDKTTRNPALLTVGHTFPRGVGSGVDRLNLPLKRLLKFLPKVEHLGTVTHHVIPTGPIGGWDAAIIRIETIKKPNARFVSQEYERFESPEKIWVHGAFTKLVSKAAVQGALNILRSDWMRWTCCWMVFPSGLLKDGDSGAAVFVEKDSSLLGMYVAQSQYRGSQLPLAHYVQDAFRLEREVLRHWNISFRMGG